MKAAPPLLAPSAARERIVLTASRLFYRDGVRATGIDKIIAESGVAKMSFYRHFPSKNDLVAEYLLRRHEWWMNWFSAGVEKRLSPAGAGLEVIAEVLMRWFEAPDFRGCAFINAQAEAFSQEDKIHQIIQDHKNKLQAFLEELATRLGLENPQQTAASSLLVIEGTIVRSQMTGDAGVFETCRLLLRRIGRQARRSEMASIEPDLPPYLPGF